MHFYNFQAHHCALDSLSPCSCISFVLLVRACCGPISLPLNVWKCFHFAWILDSHFTEHTIPGQYHTFWRVLCSLGHFLLTSNEKFAIGLTELCRSLLLNTFFSLVFWGFTMISIHVFLQFLKILRSWFQTLTPLSSAFSPSGTPNKCMELIPKSTFYDS